MTDPNASGTSTDATNQAQSAANPKWTSEEIDRYLLALAKEAAPLLPGAWADFAAAARRQGDASETRAENWEKILELEPEQFVRGLVGADDKAGIRRIAPLFAVVPRERREELLREAALSGSCAQVYRARWEGELATANFVDAVIETLLANMNGDLREAFTQFVVASGQTKWIIAADFCIADKDRPNDVFAFTVFPYYANFADLSDEIRAVLPRDLKNTKEITPEMIAYLRSSKRFHFAFVVNKDRKIIKSVGEARDSIDHTLKMMRTYNDADKQKDAITAVKALRREAEANGFNFGLLQDIMLLAAFSGFIAALLELEGRAELIGFFPDRDNMTTAYQSIGYQTFALNASAFALRRRVPESQIGLALPGPRTDGKPGMYFDELIRLPDYIAGGVAGTDLTGPRTTAVSEKCADIVNKALVDNNNAAVLRVDLPPQTLQASRIVLSSSPPAPTDAQKADPTI